MRDVTEERKLSFMLCMCISNFENVTDYINYKNYNRQIKKFLYVSIVFVIIFNYMWNSDFWVTNIQRPFSLLQFYYNCYRLVLYNFDSTVVRILSY